MTRAVVIGGGVSGLSTALSLRLAHPGLEVVLLESSARTGGCIRTRRERGFVFDAGPTGFLNKDPATLALAEQVGLGDEVLSGCEERRRRFILSEGLLRRFPDAPESFVSTDLISIRGKLRMLLEPMVPRRHAGGDESVARFAQRRLGREAAELLFDPVMSGIYAGDPERLSLQATMPHLARLDEGARSVLFTFLKARRRAASGAAPAGVGSHRYVSFAGGMGRLVQGMTAALRDSIRYETRALAVRATEQGWRIMLEGSEPSELRADAVISAAPGPAARRFLGGLSPSLDHALGATPYVPVAVAGLGFRLADVPHPLDGFGYLVPSREGSSVLGVLWPTSIYPGHRSPSDKALLRVVLGGGRHPEVVDEDEEGILARARAHLHRVLGIRGAPVFEAVARHPTGLPQYEVGHPARVDRAEAALHQLPGLYITGNAFRGIGVNNCTRDAHAVAGRVVRDLMRAGRLGPVPVREEPPAPPEPSKVLPLRRRPYARSS